MTKISVVMSLVLFLIPTSSWGQKVEARATSTDVIISALSEGYAQRCSVGFRVNFTHLHLSSINAMELFLLLDPETIVG